MKTTKQMKQAGIELNLLVAIYHRPDEDGIVLGWHRNFDRRKRDERVEFIDRMIEALEKEKATQ